MRSIKVVLGLGFAVALMMSMSVSSASATWDLCAKVGAGGHFETNKCTAAGGTNEWDWKEITAKELVKLLSSSLALEDMAEGTKIQCSGAGHGTVGPGNEDLITEIKASACTFVTTGICESTKAPVANAVHLPWKTELKLIAGAVWDLISSDGAGEPGWNVECTVAGFFKVSDTCEGEANTKMSNNAANGTVTAKFEGKESGQATCTSPNGTHVGAGLVEGSTTIESPSGNAIKFLNP